jgi:hypothetical protein
MATAVYSTSLLYPVVHEIDEDEYETCCCVDGTVMSRLSLQGFPMPLSNVNPALERSESDQSNASSKSKPDKRSLFQAKRRRSAVQRARSEGALIDVSDTQTISTEAEDKKFEEAFVLTRQVSAALHACIFMGLLSLLLILLWLTLLLILLWLTLLLLLMFVVL